MIKNLPKSLIESANTGLAKSQTEQANTLFIDHDSHRGTYSNNLDHLSELEYFNLTRSLPKLLIDHGHKTTNEL